MNVLKRQNDSVLGRLERPLLQFFAARMPASVSPDALTLLGLVGAVLVFFGYWATALSPLYLFVASLGLILNWFGDSLDGTLARYRNEERPRYGFFLDHTADLLSQILTGLGAGLSLYIKAPFAFLILSAYLAFVAYTFIRARVFDLVQIAYFSVGPTEIRLFLIVANLALFALPFASQDVGAFAMSPTDIVCVLMAIAAYSALVVQIYKDWRLLVAEELPSKSEARLRKPGVQTSLPP